MILNPVRKYLKEIKDTLAYRKYYHTYHGYTMQAKMNHIDCLSQVWKFRDIKDCIVQFGVRRGIMVAFITDISSKERNYCLFDSFEGFPLPKEFDGKAAMVWQGNTTGPSYFDNCKAEIDWAKKAIVRYS
jgi:hypothetical protein